MDGKERCRRAEDNREQIANVRTQSHARATRALRAQHLVAHHRLDRVDVGADLWAETLLVAGAIAVIQVNDAEVGGSSVTERPAERSHGRRVAFICAGLDAAIGPWIGEGVVVIDDALHVGFVALGPLECIGERPLLLRAENVAKAPPAAEVECRRRRRGGRLCLRLQPVEDGWRRGRLPLVVGRQLVHRLGHAREGGGPRGQADRHLIAPSVEGERAAGRRKERPKE
jgi:hypothetical protein